jgi:tRNA nucleotidyltransferase/poly(A) polymerase
MRLKFKEIDKFIPEEVREIAQTLKENGFQCYVVGGSIRDLILGQVPQDFDLASDATPEDIESLFRKTVPTGKKYGTMTIIGKEIDIASRKQKLLGQKNIEVKHYQITTFRKEGIYSDKRRPDQISYSKSIDDDLKRRDFTINALAYDPLTCEVVDNFHGVEDLKIKIIKTVGSPEERLEEDVLRSFRACRLAAQLDFEIENETFNVIKNMAFSMNLPAMERINNELNRIINSNHAYKGLEYLFESGLIYRVIPEFSEKSLNDVVDDPEYFKGLSSHVRLASLLKHVENVRGVMERLRFKKEDIRWVEKLIRYNLDERKASITLKDLLVTGVDIMKLGIRGEEVGKVLNQLLEEVIEDPDKNKRRLLLRRAQDIIKTKV